MSILLTDVKKYTQITLKQTTTEFPKQKCVSMFTFFS